MKMIPSARRELEVGTTNEDSLISWWDLTVIGFKPASMWRSDQLCVCVLYSLHDVIREWRLCFGHHGGITSHQENSETKGGYLFPRPAIYYSCAKGEMTSEAVSWCSNQETNNMLTMQNKNGQFAKPWMSNHRLAAVNRPVKLWISPRAKTVCEGL